MRTLAVTRLEGLGAIRPHAESIDALAVASGNYFHTLAWLEAWVGVGGPTEDELIGLAAIDDGHVVAHLPVCRMERHLHRRVPLPLRYWGIAGSGYGAADHLGPAGDPSCFDALLAAVRELVGTSAALLEGVDPTHGALLERHGFRLVGEHSCPRLDLRGVASIDQLWPKKVRKELSRRARRMADEGVEGRWIEDAAEVEAALQELRRVHLARWAAQGGAGLYDEARHELLVRLCHHGRGEQQPLLYVLEAGRSIVGSLLLLRCGTSMSSYKSGWEPAYQALSPGVAMHVAAIGRAVEEGRHTYDFLRGTSSHKYTLRAADRMDSTHLLGRGPVARLLELREGGAPSLDPRALLSRRRPASP